jgi:hypothetical protein
MKQNSVLKIVGTVALVGTLAAVALFNVTLGDNPVASTHLMAKSSDGI